MKIVVNYQEYNDINIERSVFRELDGAEIIESHTVDPVEFAEEVKDADAVITQYAPCPAEVIAAMRKAKVIVRYGIAVEIIDLAAAGKKGIRVCNVPSYCLDEVSNHALAMILALNRRLLAADRMLRDNTHALEKIRPIYRLCDATAGLLGFGNIARRLAEKLKPLVASVLAFDPHVDDAEMESRGVKRAAVIEDIFRESDYISLHVPVTPETRRIVGRELLSLMKPGACLVNTSRGAIIDEPALIDALRERRIAGAGLDVFETEPLPAESPLRLLGNVILTQHVAWYSEGSIKELKETVAREALRVLKGEEPLYEVKT